MKQAVGSILFIHYTRLFNQERLFGLLQFPRDAYFNLKMLIQEDEVPRDVMNRNIAQVQSLHFQFFNTADTRRAKEEDGGTVTGGRWYHLPSELEWFPCGITVFGSDGGPAGLQYEDVVNRTANV